MNDKDVISKIIKWNQDRGLDKLHFDLKKEVSFIFSEILELLGIRDSNHDKKAYDLINNLMKNHSLKLNDDEIADGFGDIIIYCIGSLLKLGYNPHQVLEIINDANQVKNNVINELGKVEKPLHFQKPDLSKAKIIKNH